MQQWFTSAAQATVSNFQNNDLITWGTAALGQVHTAGLTYFQTYPGCGYSYNVKLYPGLYYTTAAQMQFWQIHQQETDIQIYYPLNRKGTTDNGHVIDASGKHNHVLL